MNAKDILKISRYAVFLVVWTIIALGIVLPALLSTTLLPLSLILILAAILVYLFIWVSFKCIFKMIKTIKKIKDNQNEMG